MNRENKYFSYRWLRRDCPPEVPLDILFLRRAGTFSQSCSGFLRLIMLLMQCSQKINAALHKRCYEMTSFSQTITLLKLPADKRWCFRLFTVRWNVNFKSSGGACWKKINTFIPMVTLKQGMLIQCRALFARADTCATRQRTPLCGALLHLIKIITPSRVLISEIQDLHAFYSSWAQTAEKSTFERRNLGHPTFSNRTCFTMYTQLIPHIYDV